MSQGKRDVYVAAGTYGRFNMSGVNVFGGFDSDFGRDASSADDVAVQGSLDPALTEFVTIRAVNVTGGRLADLRLEGADATGTGRSSYVIHAADSTLTLDRVIVMGGDGAPGGNGVQGATGTQGDSGQPGTGTGGGAGG